MALQYEYDDTMWPLLLEIESALSVIPEIKTLKIGTELGISAKDTPMIRIDPVRQEVADKYYFTGSVEITFAVDTKNDTREADRQLTAFVSRALIVLSNINALSNETAWFDREEIPNCKTAMIAADFTSSPLIPNTSALCSFTAFIICYFPVWKDLVGAWSASADYSHGFFILPICSFKISGCIEPAPNKPNPPLLLTAEASRHPLHQTIPPCTTGYLVLNSSVILFIYFKLSS